MIDKAAILNELNQVTAIPLREEGDIDAYEYAEAVKVPVELARKWLKRGVLEEKSFVELEVYDVQRKSRVHVWRRMPPDA